MSAIGSRITRGTSSRDFLRFDVSRELLFSSDEGSHLPPPLSLSLSLSCSRGERNLFPSFCLFEICMGPRRSESPREREREREREIELSRVERDPRVPTRNVRFFEKITGPPRQRRERQSRRVPASEDSLSRSLARSLARSRPLSH